MGRSVEKMTRMGEEEDFSAEVAPTRPLSNERLFKESSLLKVILKNLFYFRNESWKLSGTAVKSH